MPPPVVEIDCAPRIEDEVGLMGLSDRQQHEPIPVVETLEDETLVFEVMDTGQRATVEQSLEVLLGGVVGDDPASGMSAKWLYIAARGRQDRETGGFRAPIEGRRVGPTEAEP